MHVIKSIFPLSNSAQVLEGANVTVYRNDEVTLDELIAIKPTQLVVSPGPGKLSLAPVWLLGTQPRHEQAIRIQTLASVRMQFDTFPVRYQF